MSDDPRTTTLEPVDGHALLETLAALPISTWSYVWDGPSVRHLGPMSQDFMAAFGLGADETRIDLIDANGVVMVAVQGLYRRVVALEAEVRTLRGAAPGTPGIDADLDTQAGPVIRQPG